MPFNLRPTSTSGNGPSEQKIPVGSKPLSYLRPVIVAADADGLAGTPEGDDDYYYPPAQQDFTSPISGAVQPSPPVKKKNNQKFVHFAQSVETAVGTIKNISRAARR